jgi:alpha-L-fucosidase
LRFSDCTPSRIRVTTTASRSTTHLCDIGAYYAEPLHDNKHTLHISDIPTDDWQILNQNAQQAIDGDITTYWSTDGLSPIIVDMCSEYDISGFCYAPASGEMLSGTIYRYNFYISTDGDTWQLCNTSGEFSNIMHNPIPYHVHFGTSYKARYFKIEPIEEIEGKAQTTIGEIGIILTL